MTVNISESPFVSNTSNFLAEQLLQNLSNVGRTFPQFELATSMGNEWGKDKQLEADYMLAFGKAKKDGQWRETTVEYGILADIREKCPEVQAILVKEYGRDWNVRAPENVVEQVWKLTEKLSAREAHGYEVNNVLRDYWENPKFSKDGGERIYLPEDKGERRKLLLQAQFYNSARVDSRVQMLNTVEEIVVGKGYEYSSLEAQTLRGRLLETWEAEELEREKGCVYTINNESPQLRLREIDVRIAMQDVAEKKLIIAKIKEVAGVVDMDDLLSNIGFKKIPGGDYLIVGSAKGGGRQMVYGRMAQKELMNICANNWENVTEGSDKNADIVLTNAIGMQSMAAMEASGRELVLGEIYQQRATELIDMATVQTDAVMDDLPHGIDASNTLKDFAQYMFKFTQELNEAIYSATAALTNLMRKPSEPGSWLRRSGEKMVNWADRMAVRVTPKVDRLLAQRSHQGEKDFTDVPGTVQRGKVDLNLPKVDLSEGVV